MKLSTIFFEGTVYGVIGIIFAALIFSVTSSISYNTSYNGIDFPSESADISIGLAWLLLGLTFSAVFWNIIFRKNKDRAFVKWLLILISSSTSSVLMQKEYLIYLNENNSWKLLGIWRTITLFLILAPFTFLFANRKSLIEKIQNQSSLK